MSDIGHVGWSPDYKTAPVSRARKLGPGIGDIECCICGEQLLVLAGEPPKAWKWSADGWVCPEHNTGKEQE